LIGKKFFEQVQAANPEFSEEQVQQEASHLQAAEASKLFGKRFFEQVRLANPEFSEEQVQQEASCLQAAEARKLSGKRFFEQVRMTNPEFSEEQVQQEASCLQLEKCNEASQLYYKEKRQTAEYSKYKLPDEIRFQWRKERSLWRVFVQLGKQRKYIGVTKLEANDRESDDTLVEAMRWLKENK
jgi:hypothetical protein